MITSMEVGQAELLAAAQAGDIEARNEVLVRLEPLLRFVCAKMIQAIDLPLSLDEAVQETTLDAMRSIERFEAGRGVKLTTYVGERAAFHLRHWRDREVGRRGHRPRPTMSRPGLDGIDFLMGQRAVRSWRRHAEETERRLEIRARLRRLLSERDYFIVHEIYFRGRTQRDVARELGVPAVFMSRRVEKIHGSVRDALAEFATRQAG